MAVLRGDWWAQDPTKHRPLLKNLGDIDSTDLSTGSVTENKIGEGAVTSGKLGTGAVTCTALADAHVTSGKLATSSVTCTALADAHVTSGKLATGAVTCTALADAHVTSGKLAAGAVTCTAIAAGHVLSQKASNNLVTRCVVVPVVGPVSSGAGLSSGTVVWRPSVAVVLDSWAHLAIETYENATGDIFALFGNAGTSIGQVTLGTTALAPGTVSTAGAINQANLAAGTNVLLTLTHSTCSNPGLSAIQINYITSG